MSLIKQIYHYVLAEPFTWLFYYFFQPARFQRDIAERGIWQRLLQMLRLQLPIFICYYPFALAVRETFALGFPALYNTSYCYPHCVPDMSNAIITFFVVTALGSWEAVVGSILGGLLFGTSLGIAFALAGGFIGDILSEATTIVDYSHIITTIYSLFYGGLLGIFIGITTSGRKSHRKNLLVDAFVNVISGCFIGILIGIIFGFFGGFIVGIVEGNTAREPGLGILVGSTLASVTANFIGIFIRNLVRGTSGKTGATIQAIQTIGIIFGSIVGGSTGNIGFFTRTEGLGASGVTLAAILGTQVAAIVSITFTVGYLIGYYRLVLYPISALSILKAYSTSRAYPQQIFLNLHHSSLYWDECVILPLPYLKQIFLLAIERGKEEQTLEEIDFIMHERLEQQHIAQAVLHEICLRDLEKRESLRTIANAAQRLKELVSPEKRLVDEGWAKPFLHLEDAAREAIKYYSPVDWQMKVDALKGLLASLDGAHSERAFSDVEMNRRLSLVTHTWQVATKQELDNINNSSKGLGQISNPYHPGPILDMHDSLFVGRSDLMHQLSKALQMSPRPTFLLNGERRIGKSSILKQLPVMLGSHYLSIFFDLQSVGVTSNAATFLAMIAEEVYEEMTIKGMRIKKLKYEDLQEWSRESETMAYFHFGRWLKQVERQLEEKNRVLLLAIDEFEQLEEAGRKGYLDLTLLLNWFRNTVQNHPRLALLFSGVKAISDIGPQWAGYFVNIEVLAVSFLQPGEARKLIMYPHPGISHERLFNTEVVEKIIDTTGCHPFLIQALCSKLIMHLNVEHRICATEHDVEVATSQVLETWWDTYFWDLWERTDYYQRMCLTTIHRLGHGYLYDIQQKTLLDEHLLNHTLQVLLKRDLLRYEHNYYMLATPIFSQWVERNSHL